jgi:integrase
MSSFDCSSNHELLDVLTPPEMRSTADSLRQNIVPLKSNIRYQSQLAHFEKWRTEKKISHISNNIIVAYYAYLKDSYSANSLFAKMAMLKKILFANYGFSQDSHCWKTCTATSKKNKKNQPTSKALTIETEHFENYVKNCKDASSVELLAITISIHAGLRPGELYGMTIDDVNLNPNGDFTIKIEKRKTQTFEQASMWTVSSAVTETDNWTNPVHHYKNVMALRADFEKKQGAPLENKALFMQIRDGAFHNQKIGKNYLTSISKKIAEFNGLETIAAKGYTMRRSSATILANAPGSTVHQVRKHLGHQSFGAATEYIDSSKSVQKLNSERIAGILSRRETVETSTTSTRESLTNSTTCVAIHKSDQFAPCVAPSSYYSFYNCAVTINNTAQKFEQE